MTLYDIASGFLSVLLWICAIGLTLALLWCAWVYMNDLESHSELTEEEEKRMLESLKDGRGLRTSEMGVDGD